MKAAYEDYTNKEFESRGYTKFKPGKFDSDWVICKYQKRFDDNYGKKYFITIDVYDNDDLIKHTNNQDLQRFGFEYTTQLTINQDPVNLNCFSGWTLDKVEGFIERIFTTQHCDYYEIW